MRLYDNAYAQRAMAMARNLQFFWTPNAYRVCAQVEDQKVALVGLEFQVRPVFLTDRVEIWPHSFNLASLTFNEPFPKLLYVDHMSEMIFAMKVPKIKRGDKVVQVNLSDLPRSPLITINGMTMEHSAEYARRWAQAKK